MMSTIRQAIDLIGREQWPKWGILVILALVVSGFEMLGAILVFVLVGLAADPNAAIDIPIIGDIRTIAGDIDSRTLLLRTVAFIAVFFLIRGVVQVWTLYYQRRVAENAGARLSIKLVTGYLRSPYPFHLRRNSAELIRNSHQASSQVVNQVFMPIINIAAQSALTVGLLIVLISIAPAASGFAVLIVGGAAVVVLVFVQPKLKRLGGIAHQAQRDTLGSLQQALQGIRDVKLFGAEQYFGRKYGQGRRSLARANYLGSVLHQMPSTIIETALIGFILVFLAISVIASDQGPQALPVLGLFAYVGLRLQPSVQRIVKGLNDIKYATAPVADMHRDLRLIQDIPPIGGSPDDPILFERELILDNVSYRYDEANQSALAHINLAIHVGEEIGICGPTGGGKTTLIDVITGLLTPTDGQVTVDGVDISSCVGRWQRTLGVVSQMVFLTDDTLRSNIALGIPDDEIDEGALAEAVDLAQLTKFVASLDSGLDTVVGEAGVRISGGQRQRLAIARALYHRPAVLIFDEGTSALDNVVEAALLSSLERLRGTHTILHVAHRLSTVRRSDRIIFIEDGRITGAGSYDDLAVTHEGFRQMNSSEPRASG